MWVPEKTGRSFMGCLSVVTTAARLVVLHARRPHDRCDSSLLLIHLFSAFLSSLLLSSLFCLDFFYTGHDRLPAIFHALNIYTRLTSTVWLINFYFHAFDLNIFFVIFYCDNNDNNIFLYHYWVWISFFIAKVSRRLSFKFIIILIK